MAAVRNKLECNVCLAIFKTPKILPCYHTFCQKCLEGLASNSPTRGTFRCPTCRKNTNVPHGGVSTFQENFYLSDELEEVRKSAEKERCVLHRDQAVSLLCKECDVPICQTCKTTRHDQHHTTLFTDESVAAKEELKRFLSELAKQALAVEKSLSKLSIEDRDAEKKTRELKKNIEEKVDAWIAKLTAARDEALKAVDGFAAKRQAETGQTILHCQKQQTKTEILREQIKSAFNGGRGSVVLLVRDKVKKRLNNSRTSRDPEPTALTMHATLLNRVDSAICSLSVQGFFSTPTEATFEDMSSVSEVHIIDSKREDHPFDSKPVELPYDSEPVHLRYDSEPVELPYDSQPVQLLYDPEPVELPYDSQPIQLLYDSEPVELPYDSEPVVLPYDPEPVELPYDFETVALPDGVEPVELSDDSETAELLDFETQPVQLQYDFEPVELPYDSEPVVLPYEAEPVELPYDSQPVQLLYDSEPVELPYDSEPVELLYDSEPVELPYDSQPVQLLYDSEPVYLPFDFETDEHLF